MKALQYGTYGGPEVLAIRELAPPAPAAGEVLIRVHAATVAPGDCKARAGLLQRFFSVTFPKIPGRYGAGEVAALGPGVDYAAVGDRVVFGTDHTENGSCVEYIVRPREKVAPAPTNASWAEAAAVIHEGVMAVNCVIETGQVAAGQRVLVHGGAGAVGGACIQLARHLGAEVTAVCRSTDADYVRSLGAQQVIAFDREDFSVVARDQDVVVDVLGGEAHDKSYRVLKRGGKLVYLNAAPIVDRGAAFGVQVISASNTDDHRAVLTRVTRLVEQGVLAPRVRKTLPLAAAAEAHRLVESGGVKRGRVILAIE